MGIFGQRADPVFGGLGMNALESTRVAEAMSYDPSLFATITAHEALGMKVRFEIIPSAFSNPPRLPSPLWKLNGYLFIYSSYLILLTVFVTLWEYKSFSRWILPCISMSAWFMPQFQVLQLVGTTSQKSKYLPSLTSGEKLAAFCLAEIGRQVDLYRRTVFC